MTRRRRAVLTALALLCAVAGPGARGAPSPQAQAPPAPASAPPRAAAQVPAGITKLLSELGPAWVSRDRTVIEAATSRGAREAQLRAFDNAAGISFSGYRFSVSPQFPVDLASARVRRLYGSGDVAAYQIVERYTLDGYETVPYMENGYWTFVRDGGGPFDGWRLASTSDFEALGAFSARHLWDGGPVATAKSEHFLLASHPDRIGDARSVLEVAEKAYADVARFWPRPTGSRYVMIAPSGTDELSQILQATVDLSKFVAFAAGSVDREQGWRYNGVRIYINPSRFDVRDAANQLNVVSHELIHAVTRPLTGPWVPIWVEEGLATWGASGRSELSGTGPSPDKFPEDWQFSVGTTREIVDRYVQSRVAFQVLAKAYRIEGVARFYEALGSLKVVPGTQDHQIRTALQNAGLWTPEQWEQAWRRAL